MAIDGTTQFTQILIISVKLLFLRGSTVKKYLWKLYMEIFEKVVMAQRFNHLMNALYKGIPLGVTFSLSGRDKLKILYTGRKIYLSFQYLYI